MKVLIVLSVFGVCALAQFHGAPHHHHPGHHHPPRPTGRPMMPHGPMGIHHPMSGRPTGRPHHMLHGAAQFWQNMRDRVQAWRKSHQDQTDVEEDETARWSSWGRGNSRFSWNPYFQSILGRQYGRRPTGRPIGRLGRRPTGRPMHMRPTGRPMFVRPTGRPQGPFRFGKFNKFGGRRHGGRRYGGRH